MNKSRLVRTNISNNLCLICMEPTMTHLKLKCSCIIHIHIKCLDNYKINKCLICRRNFDQYEIYDFFGFDIIAENINGIMYVFGLDLLGEQIIEGLFEHQTIFYFVIFSFYCLIFLLVIIFTIIYQLAKLCKKILLSLL